MAISLRAADPTPRRRPKEEIQQAVFSEEELHELPVECQAQFFKGRTEFISPQIPTRELKNKFRKVEERNQEMLTITTAIFDENGTMLTGLQ